LRRRSPDTACISTGREGACAPKSATLELATARSVLTSNTRILLGSVAYSVGVFAGTALLGFVVAPVLGIATGLFPIDTEASAFFSLLTLKGVPDLAILSAASGFLAPALFRRGRGLQVALYAANVLLAWLMAVSIALAVLG
jgi:hypothetical protein